MRTHLNTRVVFFSYTICYSYSNLKMLNILQIGTLKLSEESQSKFSSQSSIGIILHFISYAYLYEYLFNFICIKWKKNRRSEEPPILPIISSFLFWPQLLAYALLTVHYTQGTHLILERIFVNEASSQCQAIYPYNFFPVTRYLS